MIGGPESAGERACVDACQMVAGLRQGCVNGPPLSAALPLAVRCCEGSRFFKGGVWGGEGRGGEGGGEGATDAISAHAAAFCRTHTQKPSSVFAGDFVVLLGLILWRRLL